VVKPTTALAVQSITVCSDATTGGAFLFSDGQNVNWAPAIGTSKWIGPSATADVNFAGGSTATFTSTFNLPANATAVSLSGNVSVDNDVVVSLGASKIFCSFGVNCGTADPRPGYPASPVPSGTNAHFAPGNMGFNTSSGFNIGGSNTVSFQIFNDNALDRFDNNPEGVDFCYTVTYTPFTPPPQVALFVIGDVEAHALGDNVNFWGAQWWKNNDMSGFVANGVASFKGYADLSDNVCGGTWTSRPGNSSNPPATIGTDVAIIVTSTVNKAGPNISGDIRQIVIVHQDGGYGPNPGHRGNGPVTSIVCTAP
jgi:hypothetical protein